MNQRRNFLKTTIGGTAGLIALPNLFTGSLFAADSPNKMLQVVQIGCGRMGVGDMDGVIAVKQARVVGVCDLDSKRAISAQRKAEEFYKNSGEAKVDVKIYADYTDVLADPKVDAVVISTPDHWHGVIAVAAAIAGKHIYCQKPLSYDIAESIAIRDAVRAKKVILQTGSQQRSESPFTAFRSASEAVLDGRIGKLKTVKIGIGVDKLSSKQPAAMPVPENLNFDRWLGPAPQQDYMETRVHPQNSLDRPGWITTEDFGLGMITNWGAHHVDIAQWALGQELGGPMKVESKADFMKNDTWTVHSTYNIDMLYPNDVHVLLNNEFENGIHFEGEEGWIFCTRGDVKVTASDPNAPGGKSALRASDPKLILPLGSGAKRMQSSSNHYQNWIDSVIANRDPVAPVDQAAKTQQACSAAWISMKLGRPVSWDAAKEQFIGDEEANAMRKRQPRKEEYDVQVLLRAAGI